MSDLIAESLFTRERMEEWLALHNIELRSVRRLTVDVDPTGYCVGPLAEVEQLDHDDKGRPLILRDEAGEPILNGNGHCIVSTHLTAMRMNRGWVPKES